MLAEEDNSTEPIPLDVVDKLDTSSAAPESVDTPETVPTEFMIFLGDFVYADVPLYFGDDKEAYRRLYRRNYQSPSFRRVYEHLRAFCIFTDISLPNIEFSSDCTHVRRS